MIEFLWISSVYVHLPCSSSSETKDNYGYLLCSYAVISSYWIIIAKKNAYSKPPVMEQVELSACEFSPEKY